MNGLWKREVILHQTQFQPHNTITREKLMELAGRKCEQKRICLKIAHYQPMEFNATGDH